MMTFGSKGERIFLEVFYVITNLFIIAGVIRHWSE